MAIFRRVCAALAPLNPVVANSADQTPLIAGEAGRLLPHAGVPETALHLIPGRIIGPRSNDLRPPVAFTGSTEVAYINARSRQGCRRALIAETGGIMRDRRGTRCPNRETMSYIRVPLGGHRAGLRLLCVQEDVADRMSEISQGRALVRVATRAKFNPRRTGIDAVQDQLDAWKQA